MHLRTLLFTSVSLCFSLLFSSTLFAQSLTDDGLRLSADSISRDYETRLVILEGTVEIAVGDQVFKADKAKLNLKEKTIEAEGNVVLVTGDTVIEGTHMKYNYKTKLGKIKDGFVQNGAVVFEGKDVEKTGENTYTAINAKYTSCINCPPAWSFSGQRIDAEMGGYAYIKYPVLRVLDFPVFILPRLLVPLKSDRQSGLLVPSLDSSKLGGAAISLSYFWAVSRSEDMTFTVKAYEKRGSKAMLEHRKVLNENSQSYLQTGYMDDQAYTDDGSTTGTTREAERAFFVYKQYHQLPEGFVHRVNLNYLTDLRYVRDFSEDLVGHGDPSLENSTSVTQNTGNTHRSAEVMFHLNLLQNEDAVTGKGDAFSRNDNAVHKWPELRYSIVESELSDTNLFYKADLDYTHFARRDRSYDENPTVANTEFNPDRDFIRTGHRLIFTPEFSYPMKLANFFNVTPRVTYSEAQYRFTATESTPTNTYEKNASRRYVQTDLEMNTVFTRIFELNETQRLKHEIIPELTYSEIPWMDRPDHDFFGNFDEIPYSRSNESISQKDLDYDLDNGDKLGMQFDYRDRLFDKKLINFGLANHFVQKTFVNGASTYKKVATFKISQSYDFNEASSNKDDKRPWSAINSLLDLRFNRFETHTLTETYPYVNVTNWSSRVRVMNAYGNYVQATYSYKRYFDDTGNPIDSRNENIGMGIGFKSKYLDFTGVTNYSLITNELESWEYVAGFKPPGECWSLRVGQLKTIGQSDEKFKINIDFNFGGV